MNTRLDLQLVETHQTELRSAAARSRAAATASAPNWTDRLRRAVARRQRHPLAAATLAAPAARRASTIV